MELQEALYLAEVVELPGYRVETWTDTPADMLANYYEVTL